MISEPGIGSLDDTPVYTIKTVVRETGISSATLRAWERRYGILDPGRSAGGYRLYSERDIAVLRWLKGQVNDGVAISRAVALLDIHHRAGDEPERRRPPDASKGSSPFSPASMGPRDLERLRLELCALLLDFREIEADAVLSEAFALYPIETVVEDIITPVLIEIGGRWHSGEVSVAQEHFATAVLRSRITTLFDVYGQIESGPLAIAGTAPAEWHDVGILLVSLLLRRDGWRVIYLGQNVPLADLSEAISRARPELVCLSASAHVSAEALIELVSDLEVSIIPRPRFALGGRAFNEDPELRKLSPQVIYASSARALVALLGKP